MSLGCFAACVICSNTGTVDFFVGSILSVFFGFELDAPKF